MMEPLKYDTLKGNWATLLLATNEGGEINFSALADEIDVLIESRPNGVYSNGTAGEFYALTEDEYCAVSELLAQKCTLASIPFQIGVSHSAPIVSLRRLQAIRHLNPSAIQVILPDWFPVKNDEAIRFLTLMEEEARGIPIVLYNPLHAKRVLLPDDFSELKKSVPSLIGLKVFDYSGDVDWYQRMRSALPDVSLFVPGHHLDLGLPLGASGAYSNVACLNPRVAQLWYEMMTTDIASGAELGGRVRRFMSEIIDPYISRAGYANHACDRFLANVGGWCSVGHFLRWPYRSIPMEEIGRVRKFGRSIIPEFF